MVLKPLRKTQGHKTSSETVLMCMFCCGSLNHVCANVHTCMYCVILHACLCILVNACTSVLYVSMCMDNLDVCVVC